ncbi:MAG: LamG-like jellyroll fold domain-containing protein [Bacteroidota bacterium]|nr:LamG-like jellyroll fold domain-containing protein [Bacteroidota bacterium]
MKRYVLILVYIMSLIIATNFVLAQTGLQFDGTNDYVTFGSATSTLGAQRFTLECWFKWTGGGATTSTGTGGLSTVIPLVTKGRGEADGSNVDMNYFLGIQGGKLAADFEDIDAAAIDGDLAGQNQPILGTITITTNVWHHAAATFDGTNWRLYLDGVLDNSLDVTNPGYTPPRPQFNSIQHAGLGTAMTSAPAAGGYFAGVLDEARIWNYARTQQQIQDSMNVEITSSMGGLLGRWGLNDGTGTSAGNTISGSPAGTLTNGPTWVAGNPGFPPPPPPAAPSGLAATAVLHTQINLSWTDNSSNETTFELERSTTGSSGPFSLIATLSPNTISYNNTGLTALTEYWYRVRAVNPGGNSAYSNVANDTTPDGSSTEYALDFGGTNSYVTFGTASSVGVANFTIECWFKKKGTGRTTYTGTGGITAVPLVSKGRFETDGSTVDMNYFFGLDGATNVLAADFEEGTGSTTPGLNHPFFGSTPITNDVWYHAAVTYDTTLKRWQLYLNGVLENEEFVTSGSRFPQFNSIQHAALGTAMNSSGVDSGKFYGTLDEVRIWNYARTVDQILNDINTQINTPRTGLVGRWGLDEGTGTNVYGGAGTTVNGTIQGTNYSWVGGAPFNLPNPPAIPPAAPTNLVSGGVSSNSVLVSWTDNSNNETNFQVERSTTGSSGPFTLIGTVGVNRNYYTDTDVSAETHYYYRVRATNTYGNSIYSNVLHVLTPSFQNNAVNFDASSCYVTFGTGTALNTPTFTVETWFKRTGAGVSVTTGTGGVPDAIPLIAKGTSETEDVTKDINYFLAIKSATNTLCADFEEGSTGSSPSLNHPVIGVTPISLNKWYHAAVTYDGSTWRLYLNGKLETELFVGQPTGSATTSPVSLATSIQSNGTTAQGYFYGVMDEARIWNYARTQSQILSTINSQISTAQSGLIAC